MNTASRIESLRASGARVADSYREALALAKANPGVRVYNDAGDGWVGEHVYDVRRRRMTSVSINPRGERIV